MLNEVEYTKKEQSERGKSLRSLFKKEKKHKFDPLVNKRSLKPGCDETCFHKCSNKITKERRTFLNTEFWKLQTLKERNIVHASPCFEQSN